MCFDSVLAQLARNLARGLLSSRIKGHHDLIDLDGFWDQMSKEGLRFTIEASVKREVLMDMQVKELILHDGGVMVKWGKRPEIFKLTMEQVIEKYGK